MQSYALPTRAAKSRGVSLIEFMVVASIMLAVSAMLTPSIDRNLAAWRLRTSVNNVGNLLQRARMQAIRNNTSVTVRYGQVGTGVSSTTANGVYVDSSGTGASLGSGNGQWDSGESAVQLTGGNQMLRDGNPVFDTAGLLGYTPIMNDAPIRVSWSPRGVPCQYIGSNTACTTTPVGYLYFMWDGRSSDGWAAVSVSPAGRIRTWVWNGGTWK